MKRTKKVLFQYGYQGRRSLGQHFLVDEGVLKRIALLANLTQEDEVLEIGAGPGNLTKYLVERAGKVYALEISEELVEILKKELSAPNLKVICADVLGFNFKTIASKGKKLKVVANLPYNISTEVIFRLLETRGIFSELYLMLQKEVAERVCAKPKTKDYGILAVISQIHSEPEIIMRIGPNAFHPKPKVDSALVKFKILDDYRFPLINYSDFKKVLKAIFAKRRKTLRNALSKSQLKLSRDEAEELLKAVNINPQARAEELELEKICQLANYYSEWKKNARTA